MNTRTTKIKARIQFLEQVTVFAENVGMSCGEILKDSGGYVRNVVCQAHNVVGFSFYSDTGQSMMGGNSVRIYYHPRKKYTDSHDDLVLDIHWGVQMEECELRVFREDLEWQEKILEVMKNWEQLKKRINRNAKTAHQRAHAEEQNDTDQKLLERLHLT
jgi:hypothetical protein